VKPVRAKSSSEWHWSDFLGGFIFVWKKKPVLGAISLDLFAVLFGGVVGLLPAYADEILHVDTIGLGLMRAAPGRRGHRRVLARRTAHHSTRGHVDVRWRRVVRPVHDHRRDFSESVALGRRARHRRRRRHGQRVRARHAGAAETPDAFAAA
jgi:hypothetical protein